MRTKLYAMIFVLMMASALLIACNTPALQDDTTPSKNGAVGTILLSVNPEIEIEYDRNGLVVAMNGLNEDGRQIVATYPNFVGKDCKQVMGDLVRKIYDAGCFELEVEGNPKNIVVKLEEGSAYPDDKFLQAVADSVRLAVSDQGGQSDTMVVDRADLDQQGRIGLEKAKELVLAQLGFSEADFTDKEYELDDGCYELEFTVNGVEYEYEVDAYSGKILKAEAEKDDDSRSRNPGTSTPSLQAISLDEAKAIVLADLNLTEATFTKAKLDVEEGEYELDVLVDGVEYEYDIDANTGHIVKKKVEDDRKPAPGDQTESSSNRIRVDEAKAIVLADLNLTEARFVKENVDVEDGVYEFELIVDGIEYEYDVNFMTGAIVDVDIDDDRCDETDKPAGTTDSSNQAKITLDEAKAIVLADLNLAEARFVKEKTDVDDGVYEFELVHNGLEYDYEIHFFTGAIVEKDVDRDDD